MKATRAIKLPVEKVEQREPWFAGFGWEAEERDCGKVASLRMDSKNVSCRIRSGH